MSQPLAQEGRFKARPTSWAVEENRNGTLQLMMNFAIVAAWTGEAWEDWTTYDLEKRGYFYVSKRDGSPNEACIKSLRDSLGWDGVDLEALQNTDWSQKVVQITTGFEEYDGEQRCKIKYLNPENWEGLQTQTLDPVALKSLNAKWGSKLRAVAPKGAAKPPAKPAPSRPTPPAKSSKPVPPPAAEVDDKNIPF